LNNKLKLRENILEQIGQSIDRDYLSISNVCYFMQSIRILIEIDQCQSKYKITNHYCNWLLHKELNRAISPTIIQNIADSFQKFSSKNDLIKKINNAISLKKLIEELKEILWVNLNNKVIISKIDYDEYWIKFIQLILSQILYRPVILKEKHINIDGFEFSIYGLQIISSKDKYNVELLSKELEELGKKIIIDIALLRESNKKH
tara:strand:- start:1143 stop:1754 length:612 start_codon:yes stop_codon:yes gene_type:complete